MNGSIRKRGKSSWELRYDLPRGADGTRRREAVSFKGTRPQAQKRLRELLHQVDTGLTTPVTKETVSQFFDRWITDHVTVTTKPRTAQFYRMITRLYVEPVIGGVAMQSLTPADVTRVVKGVLDKGLSPTTARRAYATMHRALECGLKWGVVHRNVAGAIDPPREATQEVDPPDKATVKWLLDEAQSTPFYAAFHVLAYTGMRRGEVAALTWEHVNLDQGVLFVVNAAGRQNGKLTVSTPKSTQSRRPVNIDPTTVEVLRAHKLRQMEYRLSLGSAYVDESWVFPNLSGGLLDPDVLTKVWQGVCRGLGVKCRLHDLRHHHLTALIEAGVNLKAVQARAGHSSAAFTLQRYGHVTPGMDEAAALSYEKAMSG